ncbi:BRO-N domain-containing protein [Paenibacillus lautus]
MFCATQCKRKPASTDTQQLTKVFTYGTSEVRAVTIGGDPWFVAKDVCLALEVGNPSQALTRTRCR